MPKSPLALTGGFSLFLALNAGLFVMLALTHFLENAAAGALPLSRLNRLSALSRDSFSRIRTSDTVIPPLAQYNGLRIIQTENRVLLYSHYPA